MRLWLSLGVPLFAAATGCASYTSDYVAPADGRARVLWDDNSVVMSSSEADQACLAMAASEAAAPTYRYRTSGGVSGGASVVFWVPVPIVHVHHHHSGARPVPVTRTAAHPRAASPGGGSVRGAGGSKGDAPKEAFIVLAVAAIVASPFIAYGLSLGRAEPEDEVAETIDRVNAYNDLARWPGTPCSAGRAP